MSPTRIEAAPPDQETNLSSIATGSGGADATLSDVVMTVRKRKWVILAALLLGVLYGFYKAVTQPRLYAAAGTIEIRSGSSNQYRIEGGGVQDNSATVRLNSELAILKSNTLLLAVAEDLDLANNAQFLGAKPATHRNIEDPSVRLAMIGAMQGSVEVAGVPKTDLVRISCMTFNPAMSAEIVNKLIDEYINRSFSSRVAATSHVAQLLTKQLDQLKNDVETSQQRMIDLQKRLGTTALDPQHNELTSSLEDLTRASNVAEIARIAAESRFHVLSTMDPGSLDQTIALSGAAVAGTSQLAQLRGHLETLRGQYAELNANLGPNHPTTKALRDEIDELNREIQEEQKRLLTQARESLVAARANEDQTRAALEGQKAQAYKLRDDLVQYTLYQRAFDSNRTLYESLLQRLRSAGVQAGLESTEIELVDPALAPEAPSLRTKSSIITVDALVALVLGLVLAFILESLDTGLRSVADIEAVSGLPSLALIPRVRRTGIDTSQLSVAERNIATLSSPKSQFAEAFRALRTSLLLSKAGELPEVILLTSATPAEGKTTVAVNLACVLAQRDVRVLLIDADLRRPSVHHRFGMNGKVGLTSVLTGVATLEQAIQRIPELPTLDVLVSGPVPPFPTEMLSSTTMDALLVQCRGLYTHVVIDSPPLLSVTDGVVLAQEADAVVLIVRHGKSSKPALRRACDLLVRAKVHIAGIALNAVDLNSPEYYGYYGYYGYAGYASAGVDPAGWESQGTPQNGSGAGSANGAGTRSSTRKGDQ